MLVRRFMRLLFRPAGLSVWAALLAVGCGEQAPIVADQTTPPLTQVSGAPQQPSDPPATIAVQALGYVVALDGLAADTIVGTTAGVSVITDGVITPLEIWDDEGVAAPSTGRIKASVRRLDNVLIAAENGLFHTVGNKLVPSPANAALAGVDIRQMATTGADAQEVLWLGAVDGLYRLTAGALDRWTIRGERHVPTAMWASEGLLFVAYGSTFYRLDTDAVTVTQEVLDFGDIRALEVGPGDSLLLATDRGVFERASNGAYRQFTLSDTDVPAAADDLVFDPKEGTYAVTSAGVVRLSSEGDGVPVGVAALDKTNAVRVAGGDDFGVLWIADGENLNGVQLGTPLSFATDVTPVFEAFCMSCHAAPGSNGAPAVDFLDYDVAVARKVQVVQRVGTSQMPPASAPALHADSLQILLRWYASGVKP